MTKRIVLCFDGTWNTPAEKFSGLKALHQRFAELGLLPDAQMRAAIEHVDPKAGVETNVCRFYRSVLRLGPGDKGGEQTKWYDKGVGTDWYDNLSGGVFGLGLSQKIREGYWFLANCWQPGDEVFVFGFSRGAYSARSLVGMIRNCGLLPAGKAGGGPDSLPMLQAYELYRARGDGPDGERARNFRANNNAPLVPIKCVGVWDTVGELGIPLEGFDTFNKAAFDFHDTELSGTVQNAFHAIAVDEHRPPFKPTLWDPKTKPDQTIEQRWFLGAHADVGGGYEQRRLSDITLRWMQYKARACGLILDDAGIPTVTGANAMDAISDSFKAFLGGAFRLFSKRYYRPVGRLAFGAERVDRTVPVRIAADMTYRPPNDGLAQALQTATDDGLH
jgi:uncharacterized protein (DUF2235 family)